MRLLKGKKLIGALVLLVPFAAWGWWYWDSRHAVWWTRLERARLDAFRFRVLADVSEMVELHFGNVQVAYYPFEAGVFTQGYCMTSGAIVGRDHQCKGGIVIHSYFRDRNVDPSWIRIELWFPTGDLAQVSEAHQVPLRRALNGISKGRSFEGSLFGHPMEGWLQNGNVHLSLLSAWPIPGEGATIEYDRGVKDQFFRERVPEVYRYLIGQVLSGGGIYIKSDPSNPPPHVFGGSKYASGFVVFDVKSAASLKISESTSSLGNQTTIDLRFVKDMRKRVTPEFYRAFLGNTIYGQSVTRGQLTVQAETRSDSDGSTERLILSYPTGAELPTVGPWPDWLKAGGPR